MRAFIAIELPEHVKRTLAAFADRLRGARVPASWVRPEQMHLTLRFLGEVDENAIERLRGILREEYRGMKPFDVRVAGAGGFPNVRRPNVVWVGLECEDTALEQVQEKAESAARAIGLAPEDRPFTPHLTLGRIRAPRAAAPLTSLLEQSRAFEYGAFTVAAVSLFSSRLDPKGAVHTRLEEFTFCSRSI